MVRTRLLQNNSFNSALCQGVLVFLFVICFSSSFCFAIASPTTASDTEEPSPLAVLKAAEQDYREKKIDAALEKARGVLRSSYLNPEWVYQNANADLAVFNIKAGHADESARLIRELLLQFQMASPMDPKYAESPADAYFDSVRATKAFFDEILKRLGEGDDTKAIVNSLVDNTVPKNYSQRLKDYCNQVQEALKPLDDIKTIIDSEELKYGDPLSSLEVFEENKTDPRLSKTTLDKVGGRLDELATEAQQMPVGDARPALALKRVALAANSAGRYDQAESFALKSLAHIKALADEVSGLADVRIALACSYVKQGKIAEFKTLKDELLKNHDGRERLLITLARFSEATGDGAGALVIYKIAMDKRKKNGNEQKPEWFEDYDALLKKESEQPESPKHDMFQEKTSTQGPSSQ